MGFFDDLGKKVTDAGQKAMQKTQEMSEIVRVNSLISQNENKINNAYVQIGKLFVSTYGNECEPEFAEMVATVAELEQQIAEYKKQIQIGSVYSFPVAAQRDVHIDPKPGGQ